MQKRLKCIEINFHCHYEYNDPKDIIAKHAASNRWMHHATNEMDIVLIKHGNFHTTIEKDNMRYVFFKRSNSFWQIPITTLQFAKTEKPAIVIIQGFIFPLQVLALKRYVGKGCKIFLQHHGEVPLRRKKIFQQLADRAVNGYLFTASSMANEWIQANVIRSPTKCFSIPAASSDFLPVDKQEAKKITEMGDGYNFLWVGRLDVNKDPITVLKAFEQYADGRHNMKLYMIYQTEDLLSEVKKMIASSAILRPVVLLVGNVENNQLAYWYSAADYFLLASHREGGSYALMEAMACGCIPIVSDIPASTELIGNAGYSFHPGDLNSLVQVFRNLDFTDRDSNSERVRLQFKQNLSAVAIARKFLSIFRTTK